MKPYNDRWFAFGGGYEGTTYGGFTVISFKGFISGCYGGTGKGRFHPYRH